MAHEAPAPPVGGTSVSPIASELSPTFQMTQAVLPESGIHIEYSGKLSTRLVLGKLRPRVQRRQPHLSVGTDEEQARNLVVEGDNLQVMASLYRYRGQVDLIIADPPYNTGQDFRYNDRWEFDPNDPDPGTLVTLEDGARHTKWMQFMGPRLAMMKAMLKPGGVCAVCIDEREMFRLGMLMDEVFGERNRIAIINWQKAYAPKSDSRHVSTATEYVLIYAKDKSLAKIGLEDRSDLMDVRYRNPDNDPNLSWASDNPSSRDRRDHDRYGIQSPFTGAIHYPGPASWRIPRTNMKGFLEAWGSHYELRDIRDTRAKAFVIKNAPVPSVPKGQNLDNEPVVDDQEICNHLAIQMARENAELVRDEQVWPYLHFLKNGYGRPRVKRYLRDVKKGRVPLRDCVES